MFLDSSVADCVFPTAGRNYPAYFAGSTAARQIPLVHHDPGHSVHVADRLRAQRSLPVGIPLILSGV